MSTRVRTANAELVARALAERGMDNHYRAAGPSYEYGMNYEGDRMVRRDHPDHVEFTGVTGSQLHRVLVDIGIAH